MYKYSLLFCLCAFLIFRAQAQEKIKASKEFVYDLLDTTKFPEDFYIKKNNRVRYRFMNFNKNVYSISINAEQKSLYSDKPTIFNLISDIDLTKLKSSTVNNVAGETDDEPLGTLKESVILTEEKIAIEKYLKAKSDVNKLISDINSNYGKLKNVNNYYKDLTLILADGVTPYTSLSTTKLNSTHAVLANFSYTGSLFDEQGMLAFLRMSIDKLFEDLDNEYNDLIKKQNDMKQLLQSVNDIAEKKTKELNDSLKKADKNKKQSIESQIRQITDEVINQKLVADGINDLISDIKIIHGKITEFELGGFTQSLVAVYRKINLGNWEYISPSYKAEKDEMTIKIDIEPKEGSLFSSNYSQYNGEYTGSIFGFKINFSTGLFIIAGKNLIDKSYKVDTIAGDPNNNIIKQNGSKQKVQPAVGALMHFYWKQPGPFSWGGAFGFSVSSQTRLNYHGGLSFIFGEDQRVILAVGGTLSQVKEISDAYTVDQKIAKSTTLNPVPTDNFYRWGSFLALTYNLSK